MIKHGYNDDRTRLQGWRDGVAAAAVRESAAEQQALVAFARKSRVPHLGRLSMGLWRVKRKALIYIAIVIMAANENCLFIYLVMLITEPLKALTFLNPQAARRVARHTPVAART